MKRYLLVVLCVLCIVSFILSIPSISYALDDNVQYPAYTPDTLSIFNHNYSYQFTWNFTFPVGLEGYNPSLFGFYPFIISQADKYIIFFCQDFSLSGESGILIINFVNCFSFVSSEISILDISSVTVPDNLLSFSLTFNNEDGFNIRDQYGNLSYLVYFPTSPDFSSSTDYYVNLSELEVFNHFYFPSCLPSENIILESSEEIIYSQVFSYDSFSYSPSEGIDTDIISGGIDIEGAFDDLDDDIHEARGAYHSIFSSLLDSLHLGPILLLILTVSLSYFVIGRRH